MKLYRSRKNPTRWIACTPTSGWVVFPAEEGGWHKRQPVRGLDPIDLREVPLDLAANTGIRALAGTSDSRIPEAA